MSTTVRLHRSATLKQAKGGRGNRKKEIKDLIAQKTFNLMTIHNYGMVANLYEFVQSHLYIFDQFAYVPLMVRFRLNPHAYDFLKNCMFTTGTNYITKSAAHKIVIFLMRSGSNITEQCSTDATFAQASNKTMTRNKTMLLAFNKKH